jgi:uncharacterized protein (TIGR00255 family)
MIKSMTGYGKATAEIRGNIYTAEIKTLNSRQFDPILRLPSDLKDRELEVRKLLNQYLERGKIELALTSEGTECNETVFINTKIAKKYFTELTDLQAELGIENDAQLLPALLKLPEVLQHKAVAPDEEQWLQMLLLIQTASDHCNHSRQLEGKKLQAEFEKGIHSIFELLNQIAPYEADRLQRIREKFRKELEATFNKENIDENRYEQEIIYYIEKIDINEEKVRLKSHCEYFLQTMDEGGSCGKKLSFILQEIGREINTLGSKANHSNIQRLVVLMKDELEKIKEQLFNIL